MVLSVHRGAGYKSRHATGRYEQARTAALDFAGRPPDGDDIAIVCRNTTEAINHLAYRLRLSPDDTIVTTVIEHHANFLPWARPCRRRHVECGPDGTFGLDDVVDVLDRSPTEVARHHRRVERDRLAPTLDAIIDAAHDRGIPTLIDAAQLAPHRRLPATADFLVWSGHKMYAPFGAGILLGPRRSFTDGDLFLAGGGAVDLVDLDEVTWTDPPDARRPDHRTSSAPSPRRRDRRTPADRLGRHRRPRPGAVARACARAWPRSTASRCSAPIAPSSRCRWPRSPSQGCITPCGRPPQRRIRHRCPPRLLLRPPLSVPLVGPHATARSPTTTPRRAGDPRATPGVRRVRGCPPLPSTSTCSSPRSPTSPPERTSAVPLTAPRPAHRPLWPLGDVPGWTANRPKRSAISSPAWRPTRGELSVRAGAATSADVGASGELVAVDAQVHRSSGGRCPRTCSTWAPHPAQVVFAHCSTSHRSTHTPQGID